ncbi:MAG TPA: hypothetical protein VIN39_08815 [Candidatus Dormibacteraeota bacterium]|jgi:cytoskeletal protein RodZ
MVRCKRCGTENYAIDMWCSKCSHHLDWAPPEPEIATAAQPEAIAPAAIPVMATAAVGPAPADVVEPPPTAAVEPPPTAPVDSSPAPVADRRRSRRRAAVWLLPVAAAVVVAALVALPVAGWFKSAAHQSAAAPQLPLTVAVVGDTPTASPTASPTMTPAATASPTASPAPAQPAAEQPVQPVPAIITTAGDPASAIAAFYQAVAAHNFDDAAATWSAQMQAAYPPTEYINHRFAYTQQMNLRAARAVANNGQVSTVYIDLIEVYAGTTRHWVGTWQLVRDSSGWLLNQPNLRAAG